MASNLRVGTADNDVNALRNMGMLPNGYTINHYLTDTDAFFIKTDAPNGFKHFERAPIRTQMEGDFDTGNMRFKAHVSVIASVSQTHVVCLVLLEHNCSRLFERAAFQPPFFVI